MVDLIEGIGEDGGTVFLPAEIQGFNQSIPDQLRDRQNQAAILKKEVQETPTSRLFGAALMQNRLIGAAAEDITQGVSDFSRVAREEGTMSALFSPPEIDAEFDLKDSLQQSGLSEDQWGSFSTIYTKRDFDRKLDSINKENYRRELLNNAGLRGFFVETAAEFVDPLMFLPAGVVVSKVGKGGMTLKKAAAVGATDVAVAEGVNEIGLHLLQETRTPMESALNVGMSTVAGGLLGAGGQAVSRKLLNRELGQIAKIMGDDLENASGRPISEEGTSRVEGAILEGSTAGSQQVSATLDENELVTNKVLDLYKGASAHISPAVANAISPSAATRSISESLTELTLVRQKNLPSEETPLGKASQQPVESLMKTHRAGLDRATRQTTELYEEYMGRPSGASGFASKLKPARMQGKMSKTEFYEAVGRAMRNNDTTIAKSHATEGSTSTYLSVKDDGSRAFIEKAAQSYRREVYEPMKKSLIEAKLLPEDVEVETAFSYLNRVWRTEKIKQDPAGFANATEKWARGVFNAEREAMQAIVNDTTASAAAKADAEERLQIFLDVQDEDAYIKDVVNEIRNKIEGFDHTAWYSVIKPEKRGPLKDRTFSIDDLDVEEYLFHDIRELSARFTRISSAELELQRKFNTTKFEDVKPQIIDDYDKLFEKLEKEYQENLAKTKSESGAEKLKKKRDRDAARLAKNKNRDIRNLEGVWDLVRGTYKASNLDPQGLTKRALYAARQVNYVTNLAKVVRSSIPDTQMPALVHGYSRVFGDGLKPLVKSLVDPEFKKSLSKSKAFLKSIAVAAESTLNTRQNAIFNLGEDFIEGSVFERMLDSTAGSFGKYTGLNMWNDTMKEFSARISLARITDNIMSKKPLSKKEIEYMNTLGLGVDERQQLRAWMGDGAEKENGLWVLPTEDNGFGGAVQKMAAAIIQDVDRTIVTKGAGDVPIVLETEGGKVVSQFLSFAMASNQRVLMAGLQKADKHVIEASSGLVAMGMMVYYLKSLEAGRELSEDPLVWVAEGIDNSGLMAVPMWLSSNILDPVGLGVMSRLEGRTPNAYGIKASTLNLVGPSGRLMENLFKAGSIPVQAMGKGVDRANIDAALRLIPYSNAYIINDLFNYAGDQIEEVIGK